MVGDGGNVTETVPTIGGQNRLGQRTERRGRSRRGPTDGRRHTGGGGPVQELPSQSGLPEPALGNDGDGTAAAPSNRFQAGIEHGPLPIASDQTHRSESHEASIPQGPSSQKG